jgi:hypothetical protein
LAMARSDSNLDDVRWKETDDGWEIDDNTDPAYLSQNVDEVRIAEKIIVKEYNFSSDYSFVYTWTESILIGTIEIVPWSELVFLEGLSLMSWCFEVSFMTTEGNTHKSLCLTLSRTQIHEQFLNHWIWEEQRYYRPESWNT